MPKLIRLYIRQVLVGFALSAVFVGALLYTNTANLGHLVLSSEMGWVAGLMLFVFNGIVFAGVQFAIAIMRMGDDVKPSGGKRQRRQVPPDLVAVPVKVAGPRKP